MRKNKVRRQITISFLFAFLIFPFTMLFFNQTIGLHANSSGAIILFVNVWIIGNGFYWIVVLPTSAKALFHSFKCSGYFDPRNTVWINAFSDVYENAAASVSVIGVLALFSLVPSQLPMIRYISFGWLILILILVSVPFLYARSYLSKLIQYIRYSTMTDIQERIVAILQQKPSFYIVKKQKIELTEGSTDNEIDADELNQLLSIYDLTKHSESSLLKLSSSSQFINSLLLPILSFVIINYVKIVKFISDILNIIF
jgi:hypothetical protein